MQSISYTFEELPLGVDLGFEYALIDGEADIDFFNDGHWSVGDIYLEGYRHLTKAEIWENFEATARNAEPPHKTNRKSIKLDPSSWMYLAILDQLENGRFKNSVDDAVQKAIEDGRAEARGSHRAAAIMEARGWA